MLRSLFSCLPALAFSSYCDYRAFPLTYTVSSLITDFEITALCDIEFADALIILGRIETSTAGVYDAINLRIHSRNGEPYEFVQYSAPVIDNWDSCTAGNEWAYFFGSGDTIDPFVVISDLDLDN